MPFKRVWDESCPRVWEEWQDDGVRWTISDLDPKDDEEAVELYIKHFFHDEVLLRSLDACNDEGSKRGGRLFWRNTFSQRVSLACYRWEGDKNQLVAVNGCLVRCVGDPSYDHLKSLEGEPWRRVVSALGLGERFCDVFSELNVDMYLNGAGLLVVPQWRGRGLGKKLLNGREPLCRALGIPATATVFTGPVSQHEATKCGFTTLLELSLSQLEEAGLHFPVSRDYVLKLMAKKYD